MISPAFMSPRPMPRHRLLVVGLCLSLLLFGCLNLTSLRQQSLSSLLSSSSRRKPTPFPQKIWQTSKNPTSAMDDQTKDLVGTWEKHNPEWRYESLTAGGSRSFVRAKYDSRSDIFRTFMALKDPILRADLIRLLVLHQEGGLYTDADTKALKPINEWIPQQYANATNVVVGIEYDVLDGNRWGDWALDLQLCTWAVMAKPLHPLFDAVTTRVVANLRKLAETHDTALGYVNPTFHEILLTTGPAAFTNVVIEHLAKVTGAEFTWRNLTGLTEPRLVGDVLIMPVTGFGSGQAHSKSGKPEDAGALVQHMFRGTWKEAHPLNGSG